MRKFCSTVRVKPVIVMLAVVATQGCATNLTKPASEPQPPTQPFGAFDHVEMQHVQIAPAFAAHPANQKAGRKIDEVLIQKMGEVFPNLTVVESAAAGNKASTLTIEPVIKEIKFVGGAARFWAGAMAGSSAVLMQVTYRDGATGDIVAAPEFYQQAAAMGGAWSIGGSDNGMLHRIASIIVDYTVNHRD